MLLNQIKLKINMETMLQESEEKPEVSEQEWKRCLIEQDIKIQKVKAILTDEQGIRCSTFELQQMINELTDSNKKLILDKQVIEGQKQNVIQILSLQVKSLEQSLIQSNMDIAHSKAQLEVEQQIVLKLKQEQEKMNPTAKAGEQRIEKTGGMFGSFFKGFNKEKEEIQRGKESKQTEQANINYAKYLFQLNQDRVVAHASVRSADETAKLKSTQPQQKLSITDLSTSIDTKSTTDPNKKQKGYYQSPPELKSQVLGILTNKLGDERQKTIKTWMDVYVPQLKHGSFAELALNRKFTNDLRKGIPVEIRGEVWSHIIGNQLRISESLYESLLVKFRIAEKNLEEDPAFRKNIKVIEVDLHRTFTDLAHFRQGGILHQPLKNILAAFAMHRTDLGYVQGMSYVAGSLLLHLGDEYTAFQCFTNLMHKYMLFTFYSFDMPKVNIVFNVFMRLMKQHIPKLYTAFQSLGLQCSVFLFEWVVAIYSNILPLNFSARLWDSWLFHGEVYFIKICLAVCLCLWDQVNDGSYEMLIILFKGIDKYVSEETLFQKISLIQLTEKQYLQLKEDVKNTEDLEKLI